MRVAALASLALFLATADNAASDPLDVTTRLIDTFMTHADGPLEFIGGLQVSSSDRRFGGLSGIDIVGSDGVFMIGDTGIVVTGRLTHENGRLTGLTDMEIAPLFPDGEAGKKVGDAEDVALDPHDPARGVIVRERQANAMLSFRLENGRPVDFRPQRVGAEDQLLRSNRGLESVTYAPEASPLVGKIIAIAERPPHGETDIPAWIAGSGKFSIVRRDGFDISSARFLPNGDLVLLERKAFPAWEIGMRLRRIEAEQIAAGARVDGDVLLDAGMASAIDNMEGLAVSRDDAGRTILTIVSDDNFNILQRTLILQFALDGAD